MLFSNILHCNKLDYFLYIIAYCYDVLFHDEINVSYQEKNCKHKGIWKKI